MEELCGQLDLAGLAIELPQRADAVSLVEGALEARPHEEILAETQAHPIALGGFAGLALPVELAAQVQVQARVVHLHARRIGRIVAGHAEVERQAIVALRVVESVPLSPSRIASELCKADPQRIAAHALDLVVRLVERLQRLLARTHLVLAGGGADERGSLGLGIGAALPASMRACRLTSRPVPYSAAR